MTIIKKGLSVDGKPIIRMENDHLQVDVAPGVGGKVVSVFHKASDHEFVWHNLNLKLELLPPYSEYDPNFYGGIDELLPNDSSAIVAILADVYQDKVDAALAKADKKAVRAVDAADAKDLEAALESVEDGDVVAQLNG